MKSKALLGFAFLAATYVHATPIVITQTFSNVIYNDYGVSEGVGYGLASADDWVFKATIDSDAQNVSSWSDIGAFQLTSVTLTQASLGLHEAAITNASVLLFYPDFFAFTANINGAAPFALTSYEPNHFLGAHSLNEYLALITQPLPETNMFSNFGPQWEGFALDDGRKVYGSGSGFVTTAVEATVPEPSSFALLIVSCVGLLVARRKWAK